MIKTDIKNFINKIGHNIKNGKVKIKYLSEIQGYDHNYHMMRENRYLKFVLYREDSDICFLIIQSYADRQIYVSISKIYNENFISEEIVRNYLVSDRSDIEQYYNISDKINCLLKDYEVQIKEEAEKLVDELD